MSDRSGAVIEPEAGPGPSGTAHGPDLWPGPHPPHPPGDLDLPEHLGLRVIEGAIPDSLPNAQHPLPWIDVTATEALVRWGDGMGILVRDGREVMVQLDGSRDADRDARWVIEGLAVQVAGLQRGLISLHAATIKVHGRVIAVAGRSGSGKSTTAMALGVRGHQLLTDDVTLLEFTEAGVLTTPYASGVHLLADAADALGLDPDALPTLEGRPDKVAFRGAQPPATPLPLEAIVVLAPLAAKQSGSLPKWEADLLGEAAGVAAPRMVEAHGAAKLGALVDQTILDGLAPAVIGHLEYFRQLAKLANSVPVHVLHRPLGPWCLDEVVALIESIGVSE